MAGNQLKIWPGWKIVREIGAGSFGRVYEIHRQNGVHLEKAALKVIHIPSGPADLMQLRAEGVQSERTEEFLARQVDDIRNEIGVMQKFVGYSNIVSYEDYLINKHEGEIGWDILIRMELLTAMSDYMVSHPLTEELILKMGTDIAQALMILHGEGIIHRDIKPQNIFINDRGFFKLGDFGISRSMPQTGGVMSFKGSVAYMAPETFAMQGTDARSDIYSLALVLHRCLNGGREPLLNTPDFTPTQKDVAQHRRLAGESLPAPAYASKATAKVLAAALDPNPAKRYQTAAQFYQALMWAASENRGRKQVILQPPAGASASGSLSRSVSTGNRTGGGTGTSTGRGMSTGQGRTNLLNRTTGINTSATGIPPKGTPGNDLKKRGLIACGVAAAGLLMCVSAWLMLGGNNRGGGSAAGNSVAASGVMINNTAANTVSDAGEIPDAPAQDEHAAEQDTRGDNEDNNNEGKGNGQEVFIDDSAAGTTEMMTDDETDDDDGESGGGSGGEVLVNKDVDSDEDDSVSDAGSGTYKSGDTIPVELAGHDIEFGEMKLKEVVDKTGYPVKEDDADRVVNQNDMDYVFLSTGDDNKELMIGIENHDSDEYKKVSECKTYAVSYANLDAEESGSTDKTVVIGGIHVGSSKKDVVRAFGRPERESNGVMSFDIGDYYLSIFYAYNTVYGIDIAMFYF